MWSTDLFSVMYRLVSGTLSFPLVAIVEYGFAILAHTPFRLCIWCFWNAEWQTKLGSCLDVGSASSADVFAFNVKHHLALFAVAPTWTVLGFDIGDSGRPRIFGNGGKITDGKNRDDSEEVIT